MNKIICSCLFLCSIYVVKSQNIRISFENYIDKPNELGQIQLLKDVYNPSTNRSASPDFFLKNAANKFVNLPNTFYGYVGHTSGKGIVGIIVYSINHNSYREYVGVCLQTPILASKKYIVSCMLSNDIKKESGVSLDLGIYFSKDEVKQKGYSPLFFTPQIKYKINKYLNEWTYFKDTITCIEDYSYLTLGYFGNENFISDHDIYYFVDNITINEIKPEEEEIKEIKDCNNMVNSGGFGTTIFYYHLDKINKKFELSYDMFKKPDKIIVYDASDKILYKSKDYVSGEKTVKLTSSTYEIKIMIEGRDKGTHWNCYVRCPK